MTDAIHEPALRHYPHVGDVGAVALVLPGGRADSFDPGESRHLSGLRMRPIAHALRTAGRRRGLAVSQLQYRYRGWNGPEMSPVADARWALRCLRERHGDVPVVIVGHSMGGRTALRVAADDSVRGVVALAPWLPDGEPVEQLAGREVVIAHGTRDRVTSPRASRRFAERAKSVAKQVDYVSVRGDAHAMLLRAATWHRLTTRFTLQMLD